MTSRDDESEKPTVSDLEIGLTALQPSLAPGEILGERFRIVRFLGRGGMGEVYEAEDMQLRELVALKTVRPEIARDPRAMERFVREIQFARKVTHPNVCRTFDLERHLASSPEGSREVTFLTMELLTGETLANHLHRLGRLPPEAALPLVAQMAAGLGAAHRSGIVHRDFKPGNVILVEDQRESGGVRAVVTDFGLARGEADDPREDLTAAGHVMGSVSYISPEQVEGGEITPAADLYALGIVMFEMVTGEKPFVGGSPLATAVKRLKEGPPSPRTYVADLPRKWESTILRCLERDPKRRFGGAQDVVSALRGDSASAGFWGSSWKVVSVVAAVALLAGTAVTWRLSRQKRPESQPSPASALPSPPKASRRGVAVVGFKNLSGKREVDWIGMAITEMLASELAAGGQLRLIPGENVARMKVELSLLEAEALPLESMARVRRNLGADVVIGGAYLALGEKAAGKLRLDLRVLDEQLGETPSAVVETGSEAELPEMITRAGARVRGTLGIGEASQAQGEAVRGSFPSRPEAAKLYAEGLQKLRLFDALGARDLLEKAAAQEPESPLVHLALSGAWSALGYEAKARQEAQRAFELAGKLPLEERFFVEGRYREAAREWEKAVTIYRTLWGQFPDNLEYGLRLATVFASAGKAKEALEVVEALRKLPWPAGDDPRIDLAEAAAADILSDFRSVERAATAALEKGRARSARLLIARALFLRAWAMTRAGELHRALPLVQEARQIYEAAGDLSGLAQTTNRMASMLAELGDLDRARKMHEEALESYSQAGNKTGMVAVLNNLAIPLFEVGKLKEARTRCEEGLALAREIESKHLTATVLCNLGLVLVDQGELSQARRALEEGLDLSRSIGNKSGEAVALLAYGPLFLLEGDLPTARQKLEASLDIARSMDRRFQAYSLLALGEVLSAQGDLAKARQSLEESLTIRTEMGAKLLAAESRLALAWLSFEEARHSDAEGAAREAAKEFRARGHVGKEALAQAVLALSLFEQGKREESLREAGTAALLVSGAESPSQRLSVVMAVARVRGLSGRPSEARKSIEAILAEARRRGLVGVQLEARFALAEIDIAAGRTAVRGDLEALEKDASAKGFGLVARKAAETLSRVKAQAVGR